MKTKVVRATEFQLVGKNGLLRATLNVNPDNTPNLRFFDSEGLTRLDLFLRADGAPLINMNAGKGKCRVAFGLLENGSPILTFYDKKERPICQYEIIEKKGDIEVVRRKYRCR
jgi:hypothetical protein